LIVRPRCLLLDEPLSNLDAKLRLGMRAEIRRLVKEFGVTTIYVTHDQKEALSIADRIAILNRGRVAQIGTPREIYHRPQSRFVASFVGEANFLCGKITWATNDRAKIDIGTHELLGILNDPNWRPKAAESVLVMIRPESIRLSADGVAANSFRGRITETAYLGEIAQYEFITPHFTLKIYELNPRFTDQSGRTELHAHVDPADVIILPAEQNS
jgi:iron(III) transport system ATP-binding protein